MQIKKYLAGEDLKKVFIYPKVVDLGRVNLNSTEKRTFCIRNEMGTHLAAKVETPYDELSESYKLRQIIPPFK